MSSVFSSLRRTCDNIAILTINEDYKDLTPYPRVEESPIIISTDVIRHNDGSAVTAHVLKEFRPFKLKLEMFMFNSEEIMLDRLLNDLKEVRHVPIQSC